MGIHCEQVIDISTPISLAEGRIEQIRDWLLRTGSVIDGVPKDDLNPGETTFTLRPGAITPGGLVTVVTGEIWVAGDGTTPPVCPVCRHETDWEVLEQWSTDRVEPRHLCSACDYAALIGDWDLEGSVAVGSVALILQTSGAGLDLAASVRTWCDSLRRALGGRWAYVHHHE